MIINHGEHDSSHNMNFPSTVPGLPMPLPPLSTSLWENASLDSIPVYEVCRFLNFVQVGYAGCTLCDWLSLLTITSLWLHSTVVSCLKLVCRTPLHVCIYIYIHGYHINICMCIYYHTYQCIKHMIMWINV